MTFTRRLNFAVQTLVVGFAVLALTPAADATLVYTIERTNADQSTVYGGYQVTSNSSAPTTTIGFYYTASAASAGMGTLTTLGTANFGLSTTDAALLMITSSGQSQQNASGLLSFVVGNESQFVSNITGPLYFRVNVSQDAFTTPTTNPLGFQIGLTQQGVNDATSRFQATLTTDGGAHSGALGPISGANVVSGLIPVTNNTQGGFTVLGTTFITLDMSGDGGSDNGLTTTSRANVTATPEPATILSTLLGLGFVAGVSRLRCKTSG
jgi:hypothetical protein